MSRLLSGDELHQTSILARARTAQKIIESIESGSTLMELAAQGAMSAAVEITAPPPDADLWRSGDAAADVGRRVTDHFATCGIKVKSIYKTKVENGSATIRVCLDWSEPTRQSLRSNVSGQCPICHAVDLVVAMAPCGHALCFDCAERTKTCPICKAQARGFQNLFVDAPEKEDDVAPPKRPRVECPTDCRKSPRTGSA